MSETVYLLPAVQGFPFDDLKAIAAETGDEIYVVGGYVRDYLMGRASKDVDVVTLNNGLELARRFADRIGATEVAVYENFGTAMVKYYAPAPDGGKEEFIVEFVGARKESYRRESRKPIVEGGTLYDDQSRRDFTLNAMSISLNPADFGRLVDPFDGQIDLKNRVLRTPLPAEQTFSDDPLRMLRAVRFATRLGFSIEPNTYEALKENRDRLNIVSMERISDELNKIMMAEKPSVGYKILFDTGLLQIVLPELARMQGVDYINGQGHKDNFYHTLTVLDNACRLSDNLWLRWAALLHDIGKPLTKKYIQGVGWSFHGHEERGAKMTPKIFGRLRLPLDAKMRYVQKLVRLHQRPIALVDEIVTDSAIRRLVVEAGEDLEDLLTLCRADITTRNEAKMRNYLANYDQIEQRIREVEERDNLRNWQPPITGEIIMDYFKLSPGKMVGEIKNAVREAILEGEITNDYEPAFAYMRRVGAQMLGREEQES